MLQTRRSMQRILLLSHKERKVDIDLLLKEKSGIRLDIGCGENKQAGFVGLDYRALETVDIVWDINMHPWPLPDECVIMAMASHVLEHIPPTSSDPRLIALIRFLVEQGIVPGDKLYEVVGNIDSKPRFIAFMDEVWRILKVGGEFAISVPHGSSQGYLQDPTHCNAMNESRWAYFDPEEQYTGGLLWRIYRPLPWKIKFLTWDPSANMEVVLIKRPWEDKYNFQGGLV